MKDTVILGVGTALLTGVSIGIQGTLNSNLGRIIGPVNSGVIINVMGGLSAGIVLFIIIMLQNGTTAEFFATDNLKIALIAGILGIIIMGGASFAFQRAGIAAVSATIFLGQMLVGVIVDAMGWSGLEPIPVDFQRIAGLLVLALAVFLILPKE